MLGKEGDLTTHYPQITWNTRLPTGVILGSSDHGLPPYFLVCFAKFKRIYIRLTSCVILVHMAYEVIHTPFKEYLGSKWDRIYHLGCS